jgi:hypothetical protein
MSISPMNIEEMNQWRLNHAREVYQSFQISKICMDIEPENKSDAWKLCHITKELSNQYSQDYLGDSYQYPLRCGSHTNIGEPIMIDLSEDDE